MVIMDKIANETNQTVPPHPPRDPRHHLLTGAGPSRICGIHRHRDLRGCSRFLDGDFPDQSGRADHLVAEHDASHRRRGPVADRHPIHTGAKPAHHGPFGQWDGGSSGYRRRWQLRGRAPQDILGTWESNLSGGVYQLDFNPNALFAIVGPADGETTSSAGVYTGNGSINGNTGHNPFTAKTATFKLGSPGIDPDTVITGVSFIYNTGLSQVVPGTPNTPELIPTVPEPATMGFGLAILAVCGATRRRRAQRAVC
jgi:hypothetical protein